MELRFLAEELFNMDDGDRKLDLVQAGPLEKVELLVL